MANGIISKGTGFILLFLCLMAAVSGCGSRSSADSEAAENSTNIKQSKPDAPELPEGEGSFADATREDRVQDVMDNPVFGAYGRLIFPVDRTISSGLTLKNVSDILTWYTYINPDKTMEIVNYFGENAAVGDTIFYDIYTEEEKVEDPQKENTGLFFFRGEPNGKVAICNAGGGFVYVGAMQDSFPHALELSKKGYNAFALIYRPGADTACEDLARAIAFLHEHAEELQIDMTDYSLWGGSAGARMAAWLGSYGTESFGEEAYPRPAAVIMQYTGLSEVTGEKPPTYNCVGTSDGIASYRTMEEPYENQKPSSLSPFRHCLAGFCFSRLRQQWYEQRRECGCLSDTGGNTGKYQCDEPSVHRLRL